MSSDNPKKPGKPDISLLEKGKEALAFIDKDAQREVKVAVSLRLPQSLVEKVLTLAAQETLRTKTRVTPHDIYVRAIRAYLDQIP